MGFKRRPDLLQMKLNKKGHPVLGWPLNINLGLY